MTLTPSDIGIGDDDVADRLATAAEELADEHYGVDETSLHNGIIDGIAHVKFTFSRGEPPSSFDDDLAGRGLVIATATVTDDNALQYAVTTLGIYQTVVDEYQSDDEDATDD